MSSILPSGAERFAPKTPAIDFENTLDKSALKDKSVLITGAASGIGLALARRIASHGAYVSLADIQDEQGHAAANDLLSQGHRVQFIHCDVTDYNSQAAAFRSAIKFGSGSLDIVIPAAGVVHQQSLVDMAADPEPPSMDTVPKKPGYSGADINLKGVYYSCYLALHYFRLPPAATSEDFKRAIVLVASAAGYIGAPDSTTYSLSKFGVRGIFYSIREKASKANVRVNLVAPWFIQTPMTDNLDGGFKDAVRLLGFAPMERVVETIIRLSIDEQISGRAATIMPEGTYDAGDNIWDGYGGTVMQQRVAARIGAIMRALAPPGSSEES